MNDKSHVSLERRVCLACGSPFDTGNILLDKRLRQSMARHTVTGWGLCSEHERMFEEGFIALVECDPWRSGAPSSGNIDPEQAYRTGRLAHLCCRRCNTDPQEVRTKTWTPLETIHVFVRRPHASRAALH